MTSESWAAPDDAIAEVATWSEGLEASDATLEAVVSCAGSSRTPTSSRSGTTGTAPIGLWRGDQAVSKVVTRTEYAYYAYIGVAMETRATKL